jgi:hypothetical protein
MWNAIEAQYGIMDNDAPSIILDFVEQEDDSIVDKVLLDFVNIGLGVLGGPIIAGRK